ncbi:energy transducer TonB [Altericroceibacterium xinjiangense]|uniref:energy transducer TonB n=1 Tax=Altericroceibacterium xinjiangense TaxID=762261 RepID=UPI0013E0D4F1|nr:energy transducer TonB [Altericroceibacterium xinjiangense]
MKRLTLLLAACAALFSTMAVGKERRVYAPASPWNMEYADNSCRLIRNFSDGRNSITAAFERASPGPHMTLGLAGSALDVWKSAANASFFFGPGGKKRESGFYKMELADGRTSWLLSEASLLSHEEVTAINSSPSDMPLPAPFARVREAEIDAGKAVSSVVITEGFKQEIELQLGSMADPVGAMEACVADLVRSWGLDPQRLETLSCAPQLLNAPEVGNTARYPREMLRQSLGGLVEVRLIVDELGRADTCHINVAEPGPFEEAACKALMSVARFNPALDAEGKPTRSYWTQRIVFR